MTEDERQHGETVLPEDSQHEQDVANVKKIMEMTRANYPNANVDKIWRAYLVADTMHSGQKRKSGEPFVVHPIAVAMMLAEMEMDVNCIVAGMLHDVIEDTSMTYDDIQAEFGSEIAHLVDGVTKLKRIGDATKEEQQAENMRKMFLAMAEDMRVVVIKLVDRLHNMRTLQYVNTDKQLKKAQETLDIYCPLAHRFGMTKIKWELEDLCFKYLDPDGYAALAAQLNQKRSEREEYIRQIISTVQEAIRKEGFEAYLDGRPKHLYSIKKKMETQNKQLDQIFDLLAIRVIVDNVAQCYRVLGIIHQLYTPVPHRFKDYIATPKPNMYQSIHTTVIGHGGIAFEAQIRTWDMHNAAELGIAAHWRYKENGGKAGHRDEKEEKKFEWVRKLFDMQKEMDSTDEFMEAFKMDLFTDEVLVFTPKGEVKSLPAGSTPIDFAYAIHSDVGNRMVGARVNGELKPLDYRLQTGEMVQIITSNSPNRAPSRDWLKVVKSSEARTKLRQWFKKECREENIAAGREMLDRELKRQDCTYQQLFGDEELIEAFLRKSNLHSIEDLMNVIGFGDMSAQKAVSRLRDMVQKKNGETAKKTDLINKLIDEKPKSPEKSSEDGIIVKGVENCLVRPARCCNPVPGDAIVGYTTRARGVSVHRRDCPNVAAMLKNEANRMIEVRWASSAPTVAPHPAEIVIEAIDDGRTLISVANIINEMALKMTSVNSRNTKDNYQIIDLVVQITDRSVLDRLIARIQTVESVMHVTRTVR